MATCRFCGARITWFQTLTGRRIPVDEDPVENGNIVVVARVEKFLCRVFKNSQTAQAIMPGEPRYVSHLTTCREAEKWRHYHVGQA